jgi:hypothetical protein
VTYVMKLPLGQRSRGFLLHRFRHRIGHRSHEGTYAGVRAMSQRFRTAYLSQWRLEMLRDFIFDAQLKRDS